MQGGEEEAFIYRKGGKVMAKCVGDCDLINIGNTW